jgi:predicted phosphodiesterase
MRTTDDEFIAIWNKYHSAKRVAEVLDIDVRNVHSRRKAIQERYSITLVASDVRSPTFNVTMPGNGIRAKVEIDDGVIMVASDCHYYPGIISTAHKAFVKLIPELKPKMIVMNGDVFDGASVSRHDPIGWQSLPSVKQELEACTDRLNEIESASKSAKLHWTWGNHDMRFNTRLSSQVGTAFQGVHGMNLTDHFPRWKFSTSIMVNDHTMIKHRYHNGIHAVYNNTLKSGTSIVTGHLHSLKVTPWTDYNGSRYGVDTGTMANLDDPAFEYAEDNPKNWRSGFAVLTFWQGKLMPPELCEVISEGLVYFRGQVIELP